MAELVEMQQFICDETCFMECLVRRGKILKFENEKAIHPSVRPFFSLYRGDKNPVETQEEAEDDVIRLQAECDELGFGYDRRWGKARLEHEIAKFKQRTPKVSNGSD